MKTLEKFGSRFNIPALRAAREDYFRFLRRNRHFNERRALRFFRARPALLRLMAGTFPEVAAYPDSYAYELNIAGEFKCDFAFGNSKRQLAALIEFESGERSGLLNLTAPRALSSRAAGGLSQLLSWAMLIGDIRNTQLMKNTFGWEPKGITLMYVGGRKTDFGKFQVQFSDWLSARMQVAGVQVIVVTFDDLLGMMDDHIDGLALTAR